TPAPRTFPQARKPLAPVAAPGRPRLTSHAKNQYRTRGCKYHVRSPHGYERGYDPPVCQRLAPYKPHVVEREDNDADAEHKPNTATRKAQRQRSPEQHEYHAGGRKRKLLLYLNLELTYLPDLDGIPHAAGLHHPRHRTGCHPGRITDGNPAP